ncbi:MAG: Unknown protein [uncultured Campylobacterales bacterium]|uniref:Lipoprotein n=1 Tax=uncultured Campylobacterales bacterium TaxID=352960 RepID=A0A6S6T3M1_9BACT|nr:MAG: Unknown protein [uncultured Campylobacterales bacterium]
MLKILVSLISIIFLSSCAKYENTTSYKILIKAKSNLSFLDTGFVDVYSNKTVVKLFSASSVVSTITLGVSSICIDKICMPYDRFNKKFLNELYPDKLLKNIINKNPIYDKQNLIKTNNGFIQNIRLNNIEIEYKVSNKEIYFKDRLNRIKVEFYKL